MTKILLVNIPAGPYPTDYPPVGISRVIEGVDPKLNCDFYFYDLDYFRPSFEEIKSKIQSYGPDIIGISATLTPGYSYVKKLSLFIKNNFPNVIQVLGGETTVISNIILLKTKIDFCVTGESEPTFSNLISKLQKDNFNIKDRETYKNIRGLVFLLDNIPYFTGYAEETNIIRQVNYELMAKFTDLNHYMQNVNGQFYRIRINKHEMDGFFNLFYKHNLNKKMATVFASKGCVGGCTYCHRFFKGYKAIEPDKMINYMENLTRKYDIGMIQFAEENFGSNTKATSKIINYLGERKINWAASAVRSDTVNENKIREWKAAGCVNINFGTESCSKKILNIMEKRITVEQNVNAIKLCRKYDIFVITGLMLGMPGENEKTVRETIDALATTLPDNINMPYEVCTPWLQAIPGTPVYEYARRIGFIENSLDGEERYIESLNDKNSSEISQYLNFTDYEKEEIAYWPYYVFLELIASYIKKHGIWKIIKYKKANRFIYGLIYSMLPRIIRKTLLKYFSVISYFGFINLFKLIFYKNIFKKKKKYFNNIDQSIKKIYKDMPITVREDEKYTYILREGRITGR